MSDLSKKKYRSLTIKDIPDGLANIIVREIGCYSTFFILSKDKVGSGVLIQWGSNPNCYGILTAQHVLKGLYDDLSHFGDFNQKGGISIAVPNYKGEGSVFIEFKYLYPSFCSQSIDTSLDEFRASPYKPDWAVLRLPDSPQLETLKSIQSFYRIDVPLPNDLDKGVHYVQGVPAEFVEDIESKHAPEGFAHAGVLQSYFSAPGLLKKGNHNFDYWESPMEMIKEGFPKKSFGGMSGGGLWRVMLREDKSNQYGFSYEKPCLVGIHYQEYFSDSGEVFILSNGITELYQNMLPRLLSHEW